jgi:hypothetical protein
MFLHKDKLNNTNFDLFYSNYSFNSDDTKEFFDKPGTQHYRLLTYISTLYNNKNIIDIGTHRGSSSLALSYNKTNTIYTFDVIDKVNESIKKVDNIKFQIEDIFDKDIFNKWKDIILSCPFIFLDVDPHNGTMEYALFILLQDIDYKGFLICDDIWYFKEMRDNFWYKVSSNLRYDLTDVGHWSGTGIIAFNSDHNLHKYDNSDWTLVTAYFNLTKCKDASVEINKRDFNYYINSAKSTLSLPYNLIIYCDSDSYKRIKEIRPMFLADKTKYIIKEFDEFKFIKNNIELKETFNEYRENIIINRRTNPYQFDNRNTASYYLFCMSRYTMIKEAIQLNPFNSTHFSWINFCIERMGYRNLIYLDEALSIKRNKFSTCYIDYIPDALVNNTAEYFKYGRCGMCSGFFTGNKEYMFKVCDLIEDKFLKYLSQGYGHADEQLYSPVYFENKELFEHYYGDYQQMINNYTYIYDAPEPPIYNFITNSFKYKNYEKCFDACKFVWKSYCLDKCKLSEDYLVKLCYYYMCCRKHLNLFD